MDYRTLGRSGCAVSSLCLGTMTFGVETDEAGAHEQLDRFGEAGGNFVDRAITTRGNHYIGLLCCRLCRQTSSKVFRRCVP